MRGGACHSSPKASSALRASGKAARMISATDVASSIALGARSARQRQMADAAKSSSCQHILVLDDPHDRAIRSRARRGRAPSRWPRADQEHHVGGRRSVFGDQLLDHLGIRAACRRPPLAPRPRSAAPRGRRRPAWLHARCRVARPGRRRSRPGGACRPSRRPDLPARPRRGRADRCRSSCRCRWRARWRVGR